MALHKGSLNVIQCLTLDPISRENHACVTDVIGGKFILVEETAVALVEGVREIPVEERDEKDDVGG